MYCNFFRLYNNHNAMVLQLLELTFIVIYVLKANLKTYLFHVFTHLLEDCLKVKNERLF